MNKIAVIKVVENIHLSSLEHHLQDKGYQTYFLLSQPKKLYKNEIEIDLNNYENYHLVINRILEQHQKIDLFIDTTYFEIKNDALYTDLLEQKKSFWNKFNSTLFFLKAFLKIQKENLGVSKFVFLSAFENDLVSLGNNFKHEALHALYKGTKAEFFHEQFEFIKLKYSLTDQRKNKRKILKIL